MRVRTPTSRLALAPSPLPPSRLALTLTLNPSQRLVNSGRTRGAHFKTPTQRKAVCTQLMEGLSHLHTVAKVSPETSLLLLFPVSEPRCPNIARLGTAMSS